MHLAVQVELAPFAEKNSFQALFLTQLELFCKCIRQQADNTDRDADCLRMLSRDS